jgi:hypothetical protein
MVGHFDDDPEICAFKIGHGQNRNKARVTHSPVAVTEDADIIGSL